ncbi:MAG: Na+/H+ antiporter subunit E [bacterium]|nr:Na+/H+ antiporter subunit E [bacterium]
MFLLFFIIWVAFNAKFNLEIALFGVVISTAVFMFVCRFLGHSIEKEKMIYGKIFGILHYVLVLIGEIIVANGKVFHLILTEKEEITPTLVKFSVPMKTKEGHAFYANAITLTPGTITVSLEDDQYVVHCLDEELAEGIEDSRMSQMIQKLEQ